MLERNIELLKLQLDHQKKLIDEIIKASDLDLLSDRALLQKVNEIDKAQKKAIEISGN